MSNAPTNANAFGSNIDESDLESVGLSTEALSPKAAAAVVREAPARRRNKVDVEPVKRLRIQLEENDEIPPSGQFFGAQGVGYMLKPGIPADVPLVIVSILNDAIKSVPVVDPLTRQVTGFKNRLRFPYRVLPVEQAA